jgi:ABC-2 type transport system permease protein/lipopolysaccharide transport system permease protein
MIGRPLEPAVAPPAELRYRRRIDLRSDVRDLWRQRGLIRTVAERDLRIRYAQFLLGPVWSLVMPLITVVVFTFLFKRIGHLDTSGVAYPLFAFVGVLAWNLFSSAVSSGSNSLLNNGMILNKLYCPREVFPLAAILVAIIDTTLSTVALIVLFFIYRTAPTATAVWLPVILLVELAFVLGVAMAFSTAIIYVRDLSQILAGILQAGLFVTPVAYGIDQVPHQWRFAYCAVNPMAAVIDSCRRVVLWGRPPNWHLLAPATVTSLLVLVGGYVLFRRLEGGIADVH